MTIENTDMGSSLPMSVKNVGFLLDRLGQDCASLQFLRELTQNGIEAIVRTGKPGEIVWDVDWILYDLDGGPMKLCITDTGDGMTGDEMCEFINQLSSSGASQSFSTNYGVGAKIAAATKNPAGVIYQSWKNGQGSMIHLEKDNSTGEYGLRRWKLTNGDYAHCFPLEDSVKPNSFSESGTKVVLLGPDSDADTMNAPERAASPSRWITKYLNTRYFRFPEGVTVKAREGWDFPRKDSDRNLLRTITGQQQYLDQHCFEAGKQDLGSATVHWWILKDEPALANNSGFIESVGHIAALYQDELYDQATARAGTAMLQQFGVLFGSRQVVLYVEPNANDDSLLTTNTARTTLRLNGETLPWSDWAHEFREQMPNALAEFIKEKAMGSTEKDHVKSIKDRLKGIMDLYRVSRYRPTPQGVYLSDPDSVTPVSISPESGNRSKGGGGKGDSVGTSAKGKRDSEVGDIYHLFEKKEGGTTSERSQADPFPVVKWVSREDDTRAEGDMEDKAAKYVANQNTLMVNADFRVFEDMIDRLVKAKDMAPSGIDITPTVRDVVHTWFEQALIETVIGIQQLKGSKEWGPNEIDKALCEETLTAAVMQRYHVFNSCKRDLGAKLGKGTAAA
ncbi:MAG: hypothetical protein OXL96_01100 [Candidatus Poribacteria bacterium]|nr:hypothetical protein [Candidatus Poribacteria bacterium]